jgi:hypothetical protein
LASCAFQGQTFNVRLAIAVRRQTLFDGPFELVNHVQVNLIGHRGVIGGNVLDFKARALIRRSAYDGKLSVKQFQERVSTDIHQLQGLFILANCPQPKFTVSAFVMLQVF